MDYQQQSKCEEFLNMIPPEQLLQLAKSITKLEFPSAKDAVPIIIRYTTPKELLETQLVKKKYLKDYILQKGKPVPKDAKKDELVEIILDMWRPYMPPRLFGLPDPAVVYKRKEESQPLQKPVKKQKVSGKESTSSPGTRLNKEDKVNCKALLMVIPEPEILSMAETISKIKYTSKKDAISTILMFTKTPRDLLEKISIQKRFLTSYLLQKEKPCPVNAKKKELVEIILNMWSANPKPPAPPRLFGLPDPAVVYKRKEDSQTLQKPVKKQKVSGKESTSSPGSRLNKVDKANCKALLMVIPEPEILSMAETISKIKFTSKKDAISTILMFTKTPKDLLERKSIQKSFLTLYLLQKKKPCPANAKKEEIVEIILNMWSANPKP